MGQEQVRMPQDYNMSCIGIWRNRQMGLMSKWHPVMVAPFDRDLQLGVIESGEVHALVFPCRRTARGWVASSTLEPVSVDPTHWRDWWGPDDRGDRAAPATAASPQAN